MLSFHLIEFYRRRKPELPRKVRAPACALHCAHAHVDKRVSTCSRTCIITYTWTCCDWTPWGSNTCWVSGWEELKKTACLSKIGHVFRPWASWSPTVALEGLQGQLPGMRKDDRRGQKRPFLQVPQEQCRHVCSTSCAWQQPNRTVLNLEPKWINPLGLHLSFPSRV